MSIARTIADVVADHTTLELECVDRMYLNVYVPLLQTAGGVATTCATCAATKCHPRSCWRR